MADEAPPMDSDNASHEAPPELTVKAFKLKGEPATDQGFTTSDGDKIRVRLVATDVQRTRAPVSGDVEVAPSGMTLSLTIAALDDDGTVKTDTEGRLLISDRHELVIDDEAMKRGDFDVQAAVETAIRQQAFCMKQRITNRSRVSDYLSKKWGGAATPAPKESQHAGDYVIVPTNEPLFIPESLPPVVDGPGEVARATDIVESGN